MKSKKLLAIIAPALLLASCGGTPKASTNITKINLSNAKTLVMGNLVSSSNDTNDEETLITVTEDEETGESTATEATYEVETGDTTTTVSNITIQRLVKLNKDYAVVSCTYNDVSYDLIVNLSTGTCVKFPDSSLLPNTKEKLGGHRSYRKYFKNYGYLNNSIAQPNEDENIFYYINYYQVAQNETTENVRRLVKLDLNTNPSSPSASVLIAPEFTEEDKTVKYSVQSFAVDCDGHVAYYATDKADLKDASKHKYLYFYNTNNPAIEISIGDDSKYSEIEPYFYAMGDGKIYCYLKTIELGKHQLAYLEVKESEESISVAATVDSDLSSQGTANSLPTKLLNIKYSEDGETTIRSFAITSALSGKKGAVINELFSNKRNDKNQTLNTNHTFGKHGPSWPQPSKPGAPNQEVKESSEISDVIDGFSGNKYGYLLGYAKDKNVFKRIKYDSSGSSYTIDTNLNDLLSSYFAALSTAEVEEVEVDGDTEDTTVIIEDSVDEESGEADSTAVVEITEDGKEETIDEIENATEVVDVNDTEE